MEQIAAQRYEKLYMVVGVVNDKDITGILSMLPADAYYIFTRPSVPRGLPAGNLAEAGAKHGLTGEIAENVPQAVERARQLATPADMIFIGGSNFTVADVI